MLEPCAKCNHVLHVPCITCHHSWLLRQMLGCCCHGYIIISAPWCQVSTSKHCYLDPYTLEDNALIDNTYEKYNSF